MKVFSNNKGNILITVILCIIFVAVGVLVIKKVTSAPENNPNATQLSDTETVHSWLNNIESFDNISLDKIHCTSGKVSRTREYILGSTKKIVYLDENGEVDKSKDIMIEDLKNSTHTFYNEFTGKGRISKFLPSNNSKYAYVDWAYNFSELKNYTYELLTGLFNEEECYIAKSKEDAIYFDKTTKLILKIEDVNDPKTYMLFENMLMNTLTEKDFEIPDDIVIEQD